MKKHMINMDQTLVFFTSHFKQTLEMRGVKTVTIHTSTQDTKWATLAVTLCADGTKLYLMLIFKGKLNGGILAVSTVVSRMHGWTGCNTRVGRKGSKTIHCNSTQKCYSNTSVEILPMSHDGINHWFNPKAWHGS